MINNDRIQNTRSDDKEISNLMKTVRFLKYEFWSRYKLESIVSLDEFEQECYVTYYKYYNNKKYLEKGYAFTTHVRQAVQSCANDLSRKHFRTDERLKPYQYDYNNITSDSDGDEINRFDMIGNMRNEYEEFELSEDVKKTISKLKPQYQEAIKLILVGYKPCEIGKILGECKTSGIGYRALKSFKKKYLECCEV